MNYTTRFGETITDVTLNSTGDISNWSNILNVNFFASWTPSLIPGVEVIIPDSVTNNNQNLSQLQSYPSNNRSVSNITDQTNAIFSLLATVSPIPNSPNVLPIPDTNVYYNVRFGESIGDVSFNGTGLFQNIDAITAANFFDSWTPNLMAGQQVKIPSTVTKDLNSYRAMNAYPANNNSVPDIYQKMVDVFDLMTNDKWILRFGYWLDSMPAPVGDSIWQDWSYWQDS